MRARTLLPALCLVSMGAKAPFAHANDTAVTGAGGSWQPLRGEHSSIRMVSEKIAINVFDGYYLVQADFVFHNLGRATTVRMGFPESGNGDIEVRHPLQQSGFKGFRTLVDGKAVPVRRTIAQHSEDTYKALWVKRVGFERDQTRHVRVEYRAAPGVRIDGSRYVTYDFTGGNWRGDVAESVLSVRFHSAGDYLYGGDLVLSPEGAHPTLQHDVLQRVQPDALELRRTHWQAQAAFSCEYSTAPPHSLEATAWAASAQKSLLTIPLRKGDTLNGKLFASTPLGLQQNNTTFVNLQQLRDDHEDSSHNGAGAKIAQSPGKSFLPLTWDAHDNSVLLSYKNRELRFWASLKTARRETGELIPLISAPLRLQNSRGDIGWYVPLQPVLQMLGTTATIKPQQHWLDIQLPKK